MVTLTTTPVLSDVSLSFFANRLGLSEQFIRNHPAVETYAAWSNVGIEPTKEQYSAMEPEAEVALLIHYKDNDSERAMDYLWDNPGVTV